jgi:hypothetical protein
MICWCEGLVKGTSDEIIILLLNKWIAAAGSSWSSDYNGLTFEAEQVTLFVRSETPCGRLYQAP